MRIKRILDKGEHWMCVGTLYNNVWGVVYWIGGVMGVI